ncbi:EthD domain-containing protein [Novosphingobium terrae]|uniref:EthD domain-containing protein n=1 Tax=Novosphingobium terrae TaxID=2726189 RepID=UPI00197FF632|nr:EthD domain-containing protein [Novosphingobium terrae]
MIRMSNVSRHRPSDTLEWFYNEWHGKHVDIMRDAPGLLRLLRRYVQNRALHDSSLPRPPLPLGPEGWDAMSQLTFETATDFIASFDDPDYIEKVRSHQLSDPSVIVSMLTEAEVIASTELPHEALKLVQFYRTKEGVTPSALTTAMAPFVSIAKEAPGLLRYVRNSPTASVAPEVFIGSRWEKVPFNQFAAFDEIYFADRNAFAAFLNSSEAHAAIAKASSEVLEPSSFSFLCREIEQINNLETA